MKLSTSAIFPLYLVSVTRAVPIWNATGSESSSSGCLVVQGTNPAPGQYATFGAAVAALGSSKSPRCIFIYPGIYHEQTLVKYGGNLTVYGCTSDNSGYSHNQVTIISNQSSAQAGTLDASSAVNLASNNVKVYNVNFANSYGQGHQAVALTANGNHLGFYGCSFLGYQDTLYAKSGQQHYKHCYIEGADDFIFGKAAAWFESCTIACIGGGSITANSRDNASDPAWYVFDSCDVSAAPGYALPGKVFLGCPWRVLARVIFQNSVLSDIINAAGWTIMAPNATPIYEEFNNTGAGSDTAHRLYETIAVGPMSKEQLWGSDYRSWTNSSY